MIDLLMMGFKEFIEKQTEIYGKFRREGVSKGINPSNQVTEGLGGYLIALRHPSRITDALGAFSERIARVVPAITYGPRNAHTTVSDFEVSPEFHIDPRILNVLGNSIISLRATASPEIDYSGWLYNGNIVIVAGKPNPRFLSLAESVIEACKKKDIELRLPWGAHITAARFTESRPAKDLKDFLALMREAPILKKSKPTSIDVCYYHMDKKGFNLEVYDRFRLV